MSEPDFQPAPPADPDIALLQRELSEAHKTIRTLMRQLSKQQERHAETVRAYDKTVANLKEAGRESTQLEQERDMWRGRAENSTTPFKIGGLTLELSPDEVSAIRKAMARLHHPDHGGDLERMKAWNSALDPLES